MSVRRALRGLVEETVGSTRPPRPSESAKESTSIARPRRPTPPSELTPADEQRPARRSTPQALPVPSRSRVGQRAEILAALSSPKGVRQALIMQEILGPPKSLQGLDDVFGQDALTPTSTASSPAPYPSGMPSTDVLERTVIAERFSHDPSPSRSAPRFEREAAGSRGSRRRPSTSTNRRRRPGWQRPLSVVVDRVGRWLIGSFNALRRPNR